MKRYMVTVRTKMLDVQFEAKSKDEIRRRIKEMLAEGVWMAEDDWCPPHRIKRVFFEELEAEAD